MNDVIMKTIDRLLSDTVVYEINDPHMKEAVFEPVSNGYWKECVRLFLAAVVFHLREIQAAPSYSDLCEFVKAARECDREKLDNIFLGGGSDGRRYYTAFLEKAGKCTVSIIVDVHMQLQKIYFDRRRIEELERVFEI